MTESDESLLLTHLAETDAPCPVCSFNLRGVTEPVCPECGCSLELTVGAPNKRLAPFTVAVVALAMGLGFDGVVAALLFVAFVVSLVFGQSPPFVWQPYFIGGTFVAAAACCGLAITAMLRGQRHWFRAGPKVQWLRALGVFAAVFFFHVAIAVLLIVVIN